MISNILNYFTSLNSAGQALFIIGVLLVITFIVLLVIVFKPEKNKIKKIYGESAATDKEYDFEEKMKNIDNIDVNDINIENDKTRNLKSIVDELKNIENKSNYNVPKDRIEMYEDEQEDTAIISIEELLKSNKPMVYERKEKDVINNNSNSNEINYNTVNSVKNDDYVIPKREIYSSVYANNNEKAIQENNEKFLNSLKEFRNNL